MTALSKNRRGIVITMIMRVGMEKHISGIKVGYLLESRHANFSERIKKPPRASPREGKISKTVVFFSRPSFVVNKNSLTVTQTSMCVSLSQIRIAEVTHKDN